MKNEYNSIWINPCRDFNGQWPSWIYKIIKIEWLDATDARSLYLASPHTRQCPDFRQRMSPGLSRINMKKYIIWALRQPSVVISLTKEEKHWHYKQDVLMKEEHHRRKVQLSELLSYASAINILNIMNGMVDLCYM